MRGRPGWTRTNMVWLDFDDPAVGAALGAFARERGVLLSSGRGHVRLVTHRDVSREDLGRVVDVIGDQRRCAIPSGLGRLLIADP